MRRALAWLWSAARVILLAVLAAPLILLILMLAAIEALCEKLLGVRMG